MNWIAACLVALGMAWSNTPALSQDREPVIETIDEALVVSRVASGGRVPVRTDLIQAEIIAGDWQMPEEGDQVRLPSGSTRTWTGLKADEGGQFADRALRGAYVAAEVHSEQDRTMILEASGHSMAYVDGIPRGGNPYGYDWFRLPVRLRSGSTPLLFSVGRGRLRARLVPVKTPVSIEPSDTTLPDLVVDEAVGECHASMVVLNAQERKFGKLEVQARCAELDQIVTTRLPTLLPLSRTKVPFAFQASSHDGPGSVSLKVELIDRSGREPTVVASRTFELRVRDRGQSRKRTFVSAIDGSVQYYAVQPKLPDANTSAESAALILTLHGASVEATNQANAYSSKDWAQIVAPTNRRPYGFDWEDWGRLDALEVLQIASDRLQTDPRRTFLTGHSMGGHGTWHLGVTYPDRFAVVAPSAGWVSMWSYAGARRAENGSPVADLLSRPTRPSDTLGLAENLKRNGVYVLHGDRDNNVPVSQARTMRTELAGFHPDFVYREQPGAGHWWGNQCVDWPPLMAFLKDHRHPDPSEVRRVDFRTASPGISATCDWMTIHQQLKPFEISRATINVEPDSQRFRGSTENVALLALSLEAIPEGESINVTLDDESLAVDRPTEGPIWFSRRDGVWAVAKAPEPDLKGPQRYGSFKDAFRNRVILVYGTRGTAEETAWALARARYDSETFAYRGNASFEIVADTDFDPAVEPHRNVILYGNAETHGCWADLVGDGPIHADRNQIRVGDHEENGSDLALLAIRPRPNSDVASVGIVSGTTVPGLKLTDNLPFFISGVAYPDVVVLGPEVLREGSGAVLGSGFFGSDWSVETGEFAWRNP